MPVLRHGEEIAYIVDTAYSATGPQDPTLFSLIQDDESAQRAFHVSEALKVAVQHYKKRREDRAKKKSGFGEFTKNPFEAAAAAAAAAEADSDSTPPQKRLRSLVESGFGGGYNHNLPTKDNSL